MNAVEQLKNIFKQEDTGIILKQMKTEYNLNNIEYLNLVAIFMTYITISTNPDIPSTCNFICTIILKYRDRQNDNINSEIFSDCIMSFVNNELKTNNSEIKIIKQIEDGIFFHSFNATFYPRINEYGLIVHDKPWNLEEIEEIIKIFKRYGISNIFGMYQGRTETPIFFSSHLATSPYYGLSSPTFFRKFIENDSCYFNTFRDRNYETAKESIEMLCMPLNENERKYVYLFFKKYWNYFASEELPCIAITTGEQLNCKQKLPNRFENESSSTYISRCLLQQYNLMIKQDIPRDSIEIFSYENLAFLEMEKKKNI